MKGMPEKMTSEKTHISEDVLPLLKDAHKLSLKNSLQTPVTIERKKRGPSCKPSERTTSVMLSFTKLEQSLWRVRGVVRKKPCVLMKLQTSSGIFRAI